MNKEFLNTKNVNNFGLVSVNGDLIFLVTIYFEFFKYKPHPTALSLNSLLGGALGSAFSVVLGGAVGGVLDVALGRESFGYAVSILSLQI